MNDDEKSPFPEMSRRQQLAFYLGILIAIALIGSLWLKPWRVAAGNPGLSGHQTATATAAVVGGCSPSDDKNYWSCSQDLRFEGGTGWVYGKALVTDDFRKGKEEDGTVVVIYDKANPSRFRLQEGNPGIATRVLGTAFLTGASAAAGFTVAAVSALGLASLRRAGSARRDG